MTEALILVFFPLIVAFAAASDLLTMTIPNRASLALVGGFLALALLLGLSPLTVLGHVAAAFVVLALAYGCFCMGWIGGGDAKFAAAAALWLGPGLGPDFLVLFSLLGGALTLLVLVFRSHLLPRFALRLEFLARLHSPAQGVPYGIALAAAALFIYPDSVFMRALAAGP